MGPPLLFRHTVFEELPQQQATDHPQPFLVAKGDAQIQAHGSRPLAQVPQGKVTLVGHPCHQGIGVEPQRPGGCGKNTTALIPSGGSQDNGCRPLDTRMGIGPHLVKNLAKTILHDKRIQGGRGPRPLRVQAVEDEPAEGLIGEFQKVLTRTTPLLPSIPFWFVMHLTHKLNISHLLLCFETDGIQRVVVARTGGCWGQPHHFGERLSPGCGGRVHFLFGIMGNHATFPTEECGIRKTGRLP